MFVRTLAPMIVCHRSHSIYCDAPPLADAPAGYLMTKDLRRVFEQLLERYPALRFSMRFTFWLRLTNRNSDDEIWEINLWHRTYRHSRIKHPPVEIRIPRSHFWALVEHSTRRLWRNAFENEHVQFSGKSATAKRLHAQFRKYAR